MKQRLPWNSERFVLVLTSATWTVLLVRIMHGMGPNLILDTVRSASFVSEPRIISHNWFLPKKKQSPNWYKKPSNFHGIQANCFMPCHQVQLFSFSLLIYTIICQFFIPIKIDLLCNQCNSHTPFPSVCVSICFSKKGPSFFSFFLSYKNFPLFSCIVLPGAAWSPDAGASQRLASHFLSLVIWLIYEYWI